MAERGLQDLIALHELLAALDDAGVPVDLGVSPGRVREFVSRVGREVASNVGRGDSLEAALGQDSVEVTPVYRRFISAWLSGADTAALLSSQCPSERLATERHRLKTGLIYPIAVTLLAGVGLAAMVSFVLPHIESTYADLDRPVGRGVASLLALRSMIPLGLIVLPAVLAAGLYAVLKMKPPRLTSKSRDVGVLARARFAQASLAAGNLIDGGLTADEALRHTGITAKGESPRRLPALLDWLRSPKGERPATANDLHAIGRLYEGMAKRGAQRFATLLPALACVIVGGGATLAYALALFVPVIEMLWAIAR